MPKEFRLYRPNKKNNGTAFAAQLSFKKENKFNPWMLFFVMAPQTGFDDNNNASFDWNDKSITVKMGDNDIGEFISVLEGRKLEVGTKGSLFHETPGGGNKIISFKRNEAKDYALNISYKTKDGELIKYYQTISKGEASVLLTLLRSAITKIYGW